MLVLILFDITLPFDIVVIPFLKKLSQPMTLLSPGFPSICQLLINLFYFLNLIFVLWHLNAQNITPKSIYHSFYTSVYASN